jgi:hypothetical protein
MEDANEDKINAASSDDVVVDPVEVVVVAFNRCFTLLLFGPALCKTSLGGERSVLLQTPMMRSQSTRKSRSLLVLLDRLVLYENKRKR